MFSMGMEGTKWSIFNAAIDMFADNSYNTVSMRDIANRVGIKASSIYNHFLSKEELLSTILQYYQFYLDYHTPDVDKLLKAAETVSVRQAFLDATTIFDPAIQSRMDKIITIAVQEMSANSQAEQLVLVSLLKTPRRIVGRLLQRLDELGKLGPVDHEAFLNLYCNYSYACALRGYSSHPVGMEERLKGLDLLATMLLPFPDSPAPSLPEQASALC